MSESKATFVGRTWKGTSHGIVFYYQFIDDSRMRVVTTAGILHGSYKTDTSVIPHHMDFTTLESGNGSTTTLHCYFQFDEMAQKFILWTPHGFPDSSRPRLEECEQLVCTENQIPELPSEIQAMSEKERLMAAMSASKEILLSITPAQARSHNPLELQFQLMRVPARFGLSVQQMEAAANSEDPDLRAQFAELDAVMFSVVGPQADDHHGHDDDLEQPPHERPVQALSLEAASAPANEEKRNAKETDKDSHSKLSSAAMASATSPSKAKTPSRAAVASARTTSLAKGSGKAHAFSSGKKAKKKIAEQKQEPDSGSLWWLLGGALVVGGIAVAALLLRSRPVDSALTPTAAHAAASTPLQASATAHSAPAVQKFVI